MSPVRSCDSRPDTSGSGGPSIDIGELAAGEGAAVRRFCLDVIAEGFGHGYVPAWHADLDDLTSGDHDYLAARRGSLLVARRQGRIVGCGGLRRLTAKPMLCDALSDRYPEPDDVGSIWRVYIEPGSRSGGLGTTIAGMLERRAVDAGYRRLYLHTSAGTPGPVRFWRRNGYEVFRRDDDPDATVHLDKIPAATSPGDGPTSTVGI